MNKKKIIVANWKMNPGSATEARALFRKTKQAGSKYEQVTTVICPPFPYLGLFANSGTGRVLLGAQDVFWSNAGRATGEVSPEMLKHLGVSCCLVGHSERRAIGETDEDVSKKVSAALREGLMTVLCVGERERDSNGAYFEFLKNQLKKSLAGVPIRFLADLVIAYEPIWAIGKSFRDSMSPADIRETGIFIRKVLSDIYDPKTIVSISIIYGGSVEPENVAGILKDGGIDGVLVGHKSLVAEDFIEILKSANLFLKTCF